MWATTAAAALASWPLAAAAQAEGSEARHLIGWLVALLVALIVAAAVLIAMALRLHQRQRAATQIPSRGAPPRPRKAAHAREAERPRALIGAPRGDADLAMETSSGMEGGVSGATNTGEIPAVFFEADSEDPTIDRAPTPGADHLDTALVVRTCTSCDKIYDVNAEFCPYDGNHLQRREGELTGPADPDVEVHCPRCGLEAEPGSIWCSHDGARLMPVDPSQVTFSPVAVVFCPTCQREMTADHHACPHDGTRPLLPMLGRQTCGLPHTGLGPMTRICPQCGLQHAQDAAFCGRDGHELVTMN